MVVRGYNFEGTWEQEEEEEEEADMVVEVVAAVVVLVVDKEVVEAEVEEIGRHMFVHKDMIRTWFRCTLVAEQPPESLTSLEMLLWFLRLKKKMKYI